MGDFDTAIDNSVTPGATQQPSTGSNGAAMGATAAGALTTAYAQVMAGRYNRRAAQVNAQLARTQRDQALQAGQLAVSRVEGRSRIIQGADSAAAAGSGIVVGAGSNAAVKASNEAASAMDKLMIQTNARREAYGYQARASADDQMGKMADLTGRMQAGQTLLNAGSQEFLEADPNYAGFRGRGVQFA